MFASRAQLALQKNHLLRNAWLAEAGEFDSVLRATNCGAMLTYLSGVLIGAIRSRPARHGENLKERNKFVADGQLSQKLNLR